MNDPDTADLMAPPLAVRWRVGTVARYSQHLPARERRRRPAPLPQQGDGEPFACRTSPGHFCIERSPCTGTSPGTDTLHDDFIASTALCEQDFRAVVALSALARADRGSREACSRLRPLGDCGGSMAIDRRRISASSGDRSATT